MKGKCGPRASFLHQKVARKPRRCSGVNPLGFGRSRTCLGSVPLRCSRIPILISRERICPSMPSLKSTVHLAVAFSIYITLPLGAQSKSSAGSAQNPGADKARIHRIEASVVDMPIGGDELPLRLDLQKLMQLYKVPGLSIAVIDNFQIVWTKAYGVIEGGSATPVTSRTLFQAGSISKPVAATGALYLVEQGMLSLEEYVNQKLKTWKVPENEFTKNEKVTLRRLMSHSAGLTVHGFPGYDVNDPMPTLVQIFNGETPANTGSIRVDLVPGTLVRYSGGGVTIEQQLMMDVMREIVLDKIGMTDSKLMSSHCVQPKPP